MIHIALRATLVALFLAAGGTTLVSQARADDCGDCNTCNSGCNTCNSGCNTGGGHGCIGHGNLPRTPPPCRPYGDVYGGDLFYNYYSQGLCDRTAGMYPAPFPTPLIAGRTYYTYQPLMPHEYLYKHHRSYHMYYDGGKGLNRTIVNYGHNPAKVALRRIHATISLPR